MRARRFRTLFSISLAVVDSAMLSLAFLLAYRLRRDIPWPKDAVEMEPRFANYLNVLAMFVISVLVVFFLLKLYHLTRATSRVDELGAVVTGLTIGTLLSVAVTSLTFKNSIFEVNLPRLMVGYAWALGIGLVSIERLAMQTLRDTLRSQNVEQDNALVVGVGETARLVLQKIKGSPFLGYRVVGIVSGIGEADDPLATLIEGVPVIGPIDDLPHLIETWAVSDVIIATPEAADTDILRVISLSQREGVSIKVFPDVYDIIASGVSIDDLGGLPLLNIRDVALRGWKTSFKRAMDIVGSAIGLVLLSPLLMLVALLIKLDSRGPVLFVQDRMGLDGRLFPVYKFRSMRLDAEARGPGWTVKGDPRITRLGRLIRRTSIDEMPQLINILLGDMSIVGPRPEQPTFVEQFRRIIPRYMERHREKAGLTGWAQVNGLRGDTSISERIKYDLWYIENWSVWLDIKIIIRTAAKFFFDRNAY